MSVFEVLNRGLGLFILRLSLGFMMLILHGVPKINRYPGDGFPDPLGLGSQLSWGLAVFAEVGCSLFLILGLWTRYTLVPLIVTMFVAVFVVHSGDPWSKKELGLIYLMGYISLFVAGAGKYSLDNKLKGR